MTGARWEVQIVNPTIGRPKVWDTYDSRESAEVVATTLRQHGMFVQVRRIDDEPDDPFSSRRRFLIAAVMAAWVRPERLTERVLDERAPENRSGWVAITGADCLRRR